MLKTILSKFTGGLAGGLGLIAAFLLFFGITYAAVTITTTSVTPGTPMTASLWNAVKTDLDNLAAEFNDIGNFNNVNLSSLQANDALIFDGTNWINGAAASGGTGGSAGTIDWGDCEVNRVTDYTNLSRTLNCSTGYTIIGLSCSERNGGDCTYQSASSALYRLADSASIKCCKVN